ncbi:hypothetical protein PsYK624_163610 [Phanerochaete sordida]|uniref:BTB domain-containing protein n=1 Tax=Phanerochaete sordida TaxID=48140 RepID=A0A9P3GSK9_9APHY|nr:hypothetical protein PsYK624_163610 [Phanerochaete sordida]
MVRRSQAQAGLDLEGAPDSTPKRQKVEEPEASTSTALNAEPAPDSFEPKHPELWWRDGNTVIAADGLSFKVHAGILEKHSSVFCELLEELQGVEQPEMFEGCRVLRVDDKGEHLAALLQILYDGGSGSFTDWRKPLKLTALRRVTLLAVKYKIQHIIDEAIARLEYIFPTSFEPDRLVESFYMSTDKSHPVHFDQATDLIAVITLAREINPDTPPSFIAMALYHSVGLTAEMLLKPIKYDGDEIMLSLADRVKCFEQLYLLATTNKTVKMPVVSAIKKPLCSSTTCHDGLVAVLSQWISNGELATFDPLGPCTYAFEKVADKHPNRRVCVACTAQLTKAIDDRRRILFASLGERFGISTWPAQS